MTHKPLAKGAFVLAPTAKTIGRGAYRGTIAKAGRNTNRADALLRKFD